MSKRRILEIAVEVNKKVNCLILLANNLGINVKNAMTSVTEEEEKKILDNLDNLDKILQEKNKLKNEGKKQINNDNKSKDKNLKTKSEKNIGEKKEKNVDTSNLILEKDKQKTHKKTEKKVDKKNNVKNFKNKKKLKEQQEMEEKFIYKSKHKEEVNIDLKKPKTLKIKSNITISEFSQKIGISASEIIKYLFSLGVVSNINTLLDNTTIDILALEYNCTINYEEQVDTKNLSNFIEDNKEDSLIKRPPVVTIMGHVDHGKTTLLDTLRKSKIVDTEQGGITQHIGAYKIKYNKEYITFLDTPGHEAFTSMRARGAKVTDIVLIIVAADDGIMPQTKEAIDHAKAADVPIIVVINKIDKPEANIPKVMQELAENGLQPESWGGDTITVEISAKENKNIDELLEMILLVSELKELKENPNKLAHGTVIEATLDKGLGPVTTLLIQGGTLKQGDAIVVGNSFGKVRTMRDDEGNIIKKASLSSPVIITGLESVPSAGDLFVVFKNEKEAKRIGQERKINSEINNRTKKTTINLEELNKKLKTEEQQFVNVIIKADVRGSAEALTQAFMKIEIENIRVKIIRDSVGPISESDIMLAVATNSIIYGFNIRTTAAINTLADAEGVDIRLHTVIYSAVEEFEKAIKGKLSPKFEEIITGHLEVRKLFKMSKIGTIAGCKVIDGEIKKDSKIRLLRDSVIVYDGILASLKREKNDVKKVVEGYECGLTIKNFDDIKIDDVIESYEDREINIQ